MSTPKRSSISSAAFAARGSTTSSAAAGLGAVALKSCPASPVLAGESPVESWLAATETASPGPIAETHINDAVEALPMPPLSFEPTAQSCQLARLRAAVAGLRSLQQTLASEVNSFAVDEHVAAVAASLRQ